MSNRLAVPGLTDLYLTAYRDSAKDSFDVVDYTYEYRATAAPVGFRPYWVVIRRFPLDHNGFYGIDYCGDDTLYTLFYGDPPPSGIGCHVTGWSKTGSAVSNVDTYGPDIGNWQRSLTASDTTVYVGGGYINTEDPELPQNCIATVSKSIVHQKDGSPMALCHHGSTIYSAIEGEGLHAGANQINSAWSVDPAEGEFITVYALAVDDNGFIYAQTYEGGSILQYTTGGAYVATAQGNLYSGRAMVSDGTFLYTINSGSVRKYGLDSQNRIEVLADASYSWSSSGLLSQHPEVELLDNYSLNALTYDGRYFWSLGYDRSDTSHTEMICFDVVWEDDGTQ